MPISLGIIPARGGSKGVKDKNLRKLDGVPLIVHTIRAAQEAKGIDNFLVSTDSEEIAVVARTNGAPVPFLRPAHLAHDTAPMIDTVRHAVEFYENEHGNRVNTIALLQPTTPLRTPDDIDGAIAVFRATPGARSLITYNQVNSQHPNYMYLKARDRLISLIQDQTASDRRQDYKDVFIRNGLVYVSSREQIIEGPKIYSDSPIGYEVPARRAVNIDSEEDLLFAQFILSSSGSNT